MIHCLAYTQLPRPLPVPSPASSSPLPKRKRVAAYARVSVEKDAMLHSLAAQVSYYNDLIRKHPDWQYAGVFADEGLAGTSEKRPEFQRLLADCRNGKIDMVIVKSISRLARNTVTMLSTVRELKSLGIDVFFERKDIHSMSEDGELMLSILASFAQEESLSVSENCRWRIQKNFKEGVPNGISIYGYNTIFLLNHLPKLPGQGKMYGLGRLHENGHPAHMEGLHRTGRGHPAHRVGEKDIRDEKSDH